MSSRPFRKCVSLFLITEAYMVAFMSQHHLVSATCHERCSVLLASTIYRDNYCDIGFTFTAALRPHPGNLSLYTLPGLMDSGVQAQACVDPLTLGFSCMRNRDTKMIPSSLSSSTYSLSSLTLVEAAVDHLCSWTWENISQCSSVRAGITWRHYLLRHSSSLQASYFHLVFLLVPWIWDFAWRHFLNCPCESPTVISL